MTKYAVWTVYAGEWCPWGFAYECRESATADLSHWQSLYPRGTWEIREVEIA